LNADDIRRAVTRIAHEIVERNRGVDDVAVIGLANGGTWLAEALAAAIAGVEGHTPPAQGVLDVSLHRDDIGLRPVVPGSVTSIPGSLDGRVVVLVDDVLYSGRTIRAALDAISDIGRPRAVQLAVLVDRGHRELPIRADYVGKNLPTAQSERVHVLLDEVDGTDAVVISGGPEPAEEAPR
jgi:pyrimidine operon attenuation protein/uracil phosphoribosyltransferase